MNCRPRLTAAVLLGMLFPQPVAAQPLHLAVLGDSLSAEYESISGLAGVDDPTEYAAITVPGWESMSWVEVLGRLRTEHVDLGGFDADLYGWGPLRFSGYQYNFAIPGFEASQFEQIVNSSLVSDPQYLPYKQQLSDVLQNEANAAVVWLGANEFRANYGYLYDGGDPIPLINNLSNDLAEVLDYVLAQDPGIQLVVANLPDLGATPDKQSAHPDPLRRANATAATLLANQAISNLSAARGLPVADVFSETYQLVVGQTVWVGPVDLFPGSHTDNHPRFQFTRDGLHPNTCLQALIASRILEVFNQAYGTGIPPITDGEILGLIGIDPMQVYLDWVGVHSLVLGAPGDDGDLDDLVNLAEFVFDLDPTEPSPSPLTMEATGSSVVARYHPNPDRERLVEVQPEWSATLSGWEPVPVTQLATNAEGEVVVSFPPGEDVRFLRLQLAIRAVD